MVCRECCYIGDNKNDFVTVSYNSRQNFKETYICKKCFEAKRYTFCELCKDAFPKANIFKLDGANICEHCHLYSSQCEHCHKHCYVYDTIFNDSLNKVICRDCFNDFQCYICNDCGSVLNGDCECNNCHIKEETSNNQNDEIVIKNYSYKPSVMFFANQKDADELFMGVELEVGGAENKEKVFDFVKNAQFDFFYYKNDGSIPDFGVEIVSHPATLGFHKSSKSHWKNILNRAIKRGLRGFEYKECGLHVHINKNYFSNDDCAKLDLFVNNYSRFFRKLSRRRSSYAEYRHKHYMFIGKYDGDRMSAINFSNNDTIEFRIFRSTMKYESLMATLELVHAVSNFVKNNGFDSFIVSKNETILNFVNFITNQNYTYLISFLKETKIIELKENNIIVVNEENCI